MILLLITRLEALGFILSTGSQHFELRTLRNQRLLLSEQLRRPGLFEPTADLPHLFLDFPEQLLVLDLLEGGALGGGGCLLFLCLFL